MSAKGATWIALAVVLAGALFIGAQGSGKPPTDEQRAHKIASSIRCPTCRSQSAANSDAPSSQAVRDEVLRRVKLGQTEGQIRAYLVSKYGEQIVLDPPKSGVSGLVWTLPVVAVAAAVAMLAVAFRRWKPRAGRRAVTDEDRALVEEALRGQEL